VSTASKPPLLDVSLRTDGTEATIVLVGDFDLSSTLVFWEVFERVLGARFEVVVVDAGGLTFADSTAIVTFLRAREAAEDQEIEFRVSPMSDALRKVVSLIGLSHIFDGDAR
jgi:anti-anti-sigma factor